MNSPILGRSAYQRFILFKGGHADPAFEDAFLASRYPLTADDAAYEMRKRGVRADRFVLSRLIKSGDLPGSPEKRAAWTPAMIDGAIELLRESLTTEASARELLGTSADQEYEALFEAARASGLLPDPDNFVRTVTPTGPGTAIATFRPLNADERAAVVAATKAAA